MVKKIAAPVDGRIGDLQCGDEPLGVSRKWRELLRRVRFFGAVPAPQRDGGDDRERHKRLAQDNDPCSDGKSERHPDGAIDQLGAEELNLDRSSRTRPPHLIGLPAGRYQRDESKGQKQVVLCFGRGEPHDCRHKWEDEKQRLFPPQKSLELPEADENWHLDKRACDAVKGRNDALFKCRVYFFVPAY